MQDMSEITLSDDKKTAAIGPGNRWRAVYEKLGEYDLAVTGGRVSRLNIDTKDTC